MRRAIPEAVSHLVLIVTAAHGGFIAPRAADRGRARHAEQKAVCEQLWAGELDTAEKLRHYYDVMGPLYARKLRLRRRRRPAARARIYSPGGAEPRLRAGRLPAAATTCAPSWRAITAPTLIIAGRHDWICPPEFSEEIHRLIPGSDLRIFEESSHSIRGDEPQKLIDAIAGFMVYRGAR